MAYQDGNVHFGIEFAEIVSIMRQRRSQDSILFSQGIEIRDRYNGDVVLPLTDVEGNPVLDPPAPRLIAQAIDGTAMAASSVRPSIQVPWHHEDSRDSRDLAVTRRNMLYSKWYDSQLDLKLYRTYRHLSAYGTCAYVVMPHDTAQCARIEIRDPLTTYPELIEPNDIREPRNVGFIFGRSIDWIYHHYPEAKQFIQNAGNRNWDTLWDMVEWIDDEVIVVGILGPRQPAYSPQDSRPYGYNGYELRRWRNLAAMCPAVVPRRATLDRIMGQMSTLISTVDLYQRMMALATIAAEKHTFPDIVIESMANMVGGIVGDKWKDGRTGQANVVTNGQAKFLVAETPPFVLEMLHELEGALRQSSGASDLMAGDASPLRTGRALSTLGSFSVDPRVEELQKIQARSLAQVNRACIAVETGYYPDKRFVAFTGLPGESSVVEYVPRRDLGHSENSVEYPVPGADMNQTTVAVAQMTGAGLVSKHTGRVLHPLIADPDQEERLIDEESLSGALLASIGQQASQGAIPPEDVARILQLLRQGIAIEDAVTQAHKEAQARQAQQAAQQPQQPGAPGVQPGLAGPGAPQPAAGGPPAIPPPPQATVNFQHLARAISAAPKPTPMNSPANAA